MMVHQKQTIKLIEPESGIRPLGTLSTATGNEVFGRLCSNFTGFAHPTKQTSKKQGTIKVVVYKQRTMQLMVEELENKAPLTRCCTWTIKLIISKVNT
jgi:hypothetical protein